MVDLHADELTPGPLPKWLLPSLLGACLVVGGLYGASCVQRYRAASATAQGNQHDTAAIVHAAQGALHDQQADAQAAKIPADDAKTKADAAEVARLRVEVARLRTSATRPDPTSATRPDPTQAAGPDAPQPVPAAVDLALLVAAQDELIGALTTENADLKTANINLKTVLVERTYASESWRAAHLEDQRTIACMRIAHEAQLAAIKAERWKGRLEGGGAALTVEVLRRVITGGW